VVAAHRGKRLRGGSVAFCELDAICNVDSYGYFAARLADALSQSDFRPVHK
jgi:hypothetical protein